jgi:hypothetical protein
VLVTERAELPNEKRPDAATVASITSLLTETARKALDAYSKDAKNERHVSKTYAIIHAPWTRSKTVRAATEFPKETRVEKKMIAALAKQALQAETEYNREKILEASVVRVQLNGYATKEPVGKTAKRIEVFTLISECEPSIKNSISDALVKSFACPPATLRSDTRALLFVLREDPTLPKETLVVNMTSEATNMIVMRKGVVTDATLAQEGSNPIVRRIAGTMMPEETLSLIRLLILDQCEAEACKEIQERMAKTEPELVKTFGEALSTLSASRRLPNTLELLTHEDLAPWLSRLFSRIDFAQFTVTTRPFSPNTLTLKDLSETITFEEHVQPDLGLGMGAALVNMEEQAA